MKTEAVKLADLVTDPNNARAHDERNLDAIVASLERFGQQKPIVVGAGNRVVAGNGTLAAAEALGWERIDVVRTELVDDEAVLYAIADNRTAELASWNAPQLELNLMDLDLDENALTAMGWTQEELDAIIPPAVVEPDGSEDDVPDLQEEYHSLPGEVYQLGPHRLACGDCTDPSTWDALLASKTPTGPDRLKMVWTDPPYGVDYVGGSGLKISNDGLDAESTKALWADAFEQLQRVSEPGAAWYAASAFRSDLWSGLVPVMARFGCTRMLAWVKDRFVMGRGDYHYRHEPIFHGWFGGAARLHPVPRDVDTVFECPRPSASKVHPTMKPVELIQPMVENSSSPRWLVGDPFGGSGSTLIACAMSGRVARLVELDPRYCDVIRRRWTTWANQHGKEPGTGALSDD